MKDVLMRALLHPLDYLGFLQKRTLILKEMVHECGDIYSFIFSIEKPFSWNAGQHGVFYFPDTNIDGKWWRAFSIASIPEEHEVCIATIIHESPSAFKTNLRALQVGNKIILRGPFGEMYIKPNMRQIVGIAGGIGITPFRALIMDIALGADTTTKLILVYSATEIHTFKSEFDALLPHPQIEIIYTTNANGVNKHLDRLVAQYQNNANYFVSGSPGMIGAIRKN